MTARACDCRIGVLETLAIAGWLYWLFLLGDVGIILQDPLGSRTG